MGRRPVDTASPQSDFAIPGSEGAGRGAPIPQLPGTGDQMQIVIPEDLLNWIQEQANNPVQQL